RAIDTGGLGGAQPAAIDRRQHAARIALRGIAIAAPAAGEADDLLARPADLLVEGRQLDHAAVGVLLAGLAARRRAAADDALRREAGAVGGVDDGHRMADRIEHRLDPRRALELAEALRARAHAARFDDDRIHRFVDLDRIEVDQPAIGRAAIGQPAVMAGERGAAGIADEDLVHVRVPALARILAGDDADAGRPVRPGLSLAVGPPHLREDGVDRG